MIPILLALICSDPFEPRTIIDVDMIELNHVYTSKDCECESRHVFSQVIFWRWFDEPRHDDRGRHVGSVDRLHSAGWVFHANSTPNYRSSTPCIGPQRLPGGVVQVIVGRYIVRAPLYRETHTSHDPEREDVMKYPKVDRPNLFEPIFTLNPPPNCQLPTANCQLP